MTRLILLRHAETEANVNQIWHGSLDAPLTPLGHAQVEATARRLVELHAEAPIDHIYVSPSSRAMHTAQAIAEFTHHTLRIEEALREMSIGDWEGRSMAHLRDVDRLWERWQADPEFAPPGGESPGMFGRRVPAIYQKLVDAHPGETLLTVTHGGVISNLLAQWFGEGPQDWRDWEPTNCAISILDHEDGVWYPRLVNDTAHLQEIGYLPKDWLQ
jgi:broad specificity phosphatase PhoE